jgi:hypothetical protein
MRLHLVVPGLLWPAASLREATRDLDLPALSALLGRGERRVAAAQGLTDWIARSFGLEGDEIPWGALRRLGEADFPQVEGSWLCADPVHLRFARDTLVLADARDLAIGMEEADALVASLNAHFAGLGRFHAAAPERWYLHLATDAPIRTQPLERVLGRSFELFLPQGSGAARWRALLNEAQMLLHAHPANAAREARGQPAINSLWLWGAGSLPALPAPSFDAVCADNPLVTGAARACGLAPAPLPGRAPAALAAAGMLAVADGLHGAAACRDLSAWRAALVQLERGWFAPLLGALHAGGLRELRLSALGDEATLEVMVGGRDRWKLWRRPCALGELAAELAQAAG